MTEHMRYTERNAWRVGQTYDEDDDADEHVALASGVV